MRDDLEPRPLDEPRDAPPRGGAAAPGDVRLEDLGRPHSHQHLEPVLGVLVLAARHPGPSRAPASDAAHQLGVAEDVVGREHLLHEVEPGRPQPLRHPHRPVDGAVARDAVGHQVAVGPQHVAGLEHRGDGPVEHVGRGQGVYGQAALEVAHARRDPRRDVAPGLVERDAVAGGAPEQLVHGLPGVLARDVPQRVVDRAQGHREQAAPPVEDGRLVHLVPELLDVESVGAHQQVLQVPVDDLDGGAAPGPHAEAGHLLVGLDDRDDGRRQLLERPAPAPAPGVVVARERRRVEQPVRALVDVDGVRVDGADPQGRRLRADRLGFRRAPSQGRGRRREPAGRLQEPSSSGQRQMSCHVQLRKWMCGAAPLRNACRESGDRKMDVRRRAAPKRVPRRASTGTLLSGSVLTRLRGRHPRRSASRWPRRTARHGVAIVRVARSPTGAAPLRAQTRSCSCLPARPPPAVAHPACRRCGR